MITYSKIIIFATTIRMKNLNLDNRNSDKEQAHDMKLS